MRTGGGNTAYTSRTRPCLQADMLERAAEGGNLIFVAETGSGKARCYTLLTCSMQCC